MSKSNHSLALAAFIYHLVVLHFTMLYAIFRQNKEFTYLVKVMDVNEFINHLYSRLLLFFYSQKPVLSEHANKNGTLNSKCVACKSHVHLVQRHFVEGKLFHRSCFK